MILTPTVWYGLQFYWQNKTKNLYREAQKSYKKKYAYTIVSGSLDQTLYTYNEENGRKLLDYYKQISEYYRKVEIVEKTLKLTPFRRSKLTPLRRSKLTPLEKC